MAINFDVLRTRTAKCLKMRGGIATIPQFYQMRYDTFTMRMFSCMFLIAYVVTMLPTILYSGSVALARIFNIEEIFGIILVFVLTNEHLCDFRADNILVMICCKIGAFVGKPPNRLAVEVL